MKSPTCPAQAHAWRGATWGLSSRCTTSSRSQRAQNVELRSPDQPLPAARRRHVEMALTIVGLAIACATTPGSFSGGQEQRVGIARPRLRPDLPPLRRADGDLDGRAGRDPRLLAQLVREHSKTVLMVTHDPALRSGRTACCTWTRACSWKARSAEAMRFRHLLFANLFPAHPDRLTVGSFAVALFLFGILAVVRAPSPGDRCGRHDAW